MSEPLRILVLEDQESDFLLLQRRLRQQLPGCVCRRVASLQSLEAAAGEPWEVVLSDYSMPGLPFDVALATVSERLPGVPVILVSGSIGEEQAVELLHRGVADFVLKDRHARLGSAILRALQEAAQERARRAAEQALRDSEARYRLLFEARHDAVYVVLAEPDGTPGRFTEVNELACQQLGYSREELLQLTPHDISEVMQLPAGPAKIAALHEIGGGVISDRHITKYGRRFPVEVSISPLYLDGQRLDLCVARDVSERVAAEQALRDSEARYRLLFESAHDAVYLALLGPDGLPQRFAEVNELACRELGYTREELLELGPLDISATRPEPAALDGLRDLLASGGGVIAAEHITKDGRRFPVEVSLSALEVGGQRMALGVARNVSERVRAEQERQALQDQLLHAQRLEAVGRLAGGVAHDFNNMLSVILGYSEEALSRLQPGSPLHDDLLEVVAAARRSADLTRQLLAFSRKQMIRPASLDLAQTISGMGRLLKRLIGEDIELLVDSDRPLWPVFVDPSQIDQVVANLVINARDAMPDGGLLSIHTRNVTVRHQRPGLPPGDYVGIEVRDTGCGIRDELRDHLFEPFFTTKAEGVGTGLGLATVYGIMQQNRGQIEVESVPGAGTTIRLFFPRHHTSAQSGPEPVAEEQLVGHGERVLLVEDEAPVRKLAVAMLTRLGYEVYDTDSPQNALELLGEPGRAVDLLLTDLVMPGMNGRELADAVRQLRPGLPVVFMSGYSAEIIADRHALAEGDSFLQKPFSKDQLGRFIRAALDG